MKTSAVILVVLLGVVLSEYQLPAPEDIIKSPERVNNVVNCLQDENKCPEEAKAVRNAIPGALRTACSECTDDQKHFIRVLSKHIKQERPDDWEKIVTTFVPSPTEEHKEAWKKFLEGN